MQFPFLPFLCFFLFFFGVILCFFCVASMCPPPPGPDYTAAIVSAQFSARPASEVPVVSPGSPARDLQGSDIVEVAHKTLRNIERHHSMSGQMKSMLESAALLGLTSSSRESRPFG